MKPVQVSRLISAPLNQVFQTIADVRNFKVAVPHITDVQFLTDQQFGKGTRFVETREMKGRVEKVELEVTEYQENACVRLVSDAGGTIWETEFVVSQMPGGVELKMRMDILPHTLLAKVITPFIRGIVAKGVESDMDAVKTHCESESPRAV